MGSLKKMKRRSGKTVGAISLEYLDIVVIDEYDRELEIVTPWKGSELPNATGYIAAYFSFIFVKMSIISYVWECLSKLSLLPPVQIFLRW